MQVPSNLPSSLVGDFSHHHGPRHQWLINHRINTRTASWVRETLSAKIFEFVTLLLCFLYPFPTKCSQRLEETPPQTFEAMAYSFL